MSFFLAVIALHLFKFKLHPLGSIFNLLLDHLHSLLLQIHLLLLPFPEEDALFLFGVLSHLDVPV